MIITETKPTRPLVGTTVYITATFTDSGGALRDPTDPTIFIERPDDTEITLVTADLTHISTGVWQGSVETTLPGQWYARAYGTEVLAAVQEGFFIVRPSILTNTPVTGNFLIAQDGSFLITQNGDNLELES